MRFRLALFALLALLICGACVSQARALPLKPWQDETLAFNISLPEGWQISHVPGEDEAQFLIAPEIYDGSEESFRIYLYFSKTAEDELQNHLELSSERIEQWMSALIDESYEIYNKNELKIDKKPAMALDFAKPDGESYLVGRVVIASHPDHTLAFVAMANREEWNATVRTFDKIVSSFKIKKTMD